MSIKIFFSQKIVIICLVLLALFLGNLKYRQYQESKGIEKEKNDLQKQAQSLDQKNQDLNKSLKYLSSLGSKEKVAREQLNLKKPGEIIYSFSDPQATTSQAQENIKSTPLDNLQKWWKYFTH